MDRLSAMERTGDLLDYRTDSGAHSRADVS